MLLQTLEYKYLAESLPSILFSEYLEAELLDYIVMLQLIFKELPYYFSQQLHHFTFPLAMYKFCTSPPTLVVLLLRKNHPIRCEVVSHCDFDLYFPNDNNVEYLFIYLLAIWISFLEKMPLPTFKIVTFKNYIELKEIFIYSRHKALIRYMICNCFLPFCGLSFHIWWCLLEQKV